MVNFTSWIIAATLVSFVSALPSIPRPRQDDDSAIGIEVAVSAPNGIPLTNSVELASQLAREGGQTVTPAVPTLTATGAVSAAVTTTPAAPTFTTPAYGSGTADWNHAGNNAAYNDCVQQCIASYGNQPIIYKPSATNTASYGTGATHTVIVAPTQGVLRYIPFAVNASVGDTIKFMWGANNHTVTKSSALLPCNRTGDALFASGTQNKDFVFTQVVNDTNPTYFYCATPGHCQRGMFGIINPATKFASPSSVSQQLQTLAANNSDIQGYAAYTRNHTAGNAAAARWGGNIDMEALPQWAHSFVAENVLYTRNFLASNPEVLKEDGSVDLSTAESTPLAIPQDLAAALNNAGSSSGSPATTIAAPSATTAAPTETPSSTGGSSSNLTNSAGSTTSPRVLVGLMAVAATFFML